MEVFLVQQLKQTGKGDTVVVHVTNSLSTNGTSIHFHGIRQNYTNPADGVNSITQCPVAPGAAMTYTWRATQYGSSWYHSHYSLQAWEGVFGGIVIHGPATANYDEDLGSLFLSDWDHETADALYSTAETSGPPTLDTGLINGTNVWENTTGTRFSTTFTSGTSYLLRLVNPSIDSHFDFSIDNHTLQVIAMDFVPIVPYETTVIAIGMGQRYDVIVTANESTVASDFWMRAIPDSFCSNNDNPDNILGIVHYGSSTGTPTTSAWDQTIRAGACADEPAASLVPYLSLDAGSSSYSPDLPVSVEEDDDATVLKWYIGSETMQVDYDDPTVLQVINGNTTFANASNVYELSTANEWVYTIIETVDAVPHPIHLHGHDFYLLASGSGTYASADPTLNTANPPRRDVAMLPASGYVVLAWQADNPGAWLMHCHIGWHVSMGLDLQWVERRTEIASLYSSGNATSGTTGLSNVCSTWDKWQNNYGLTEYDSGV
ncbi:MAG: hypothetical protein Q9165_008210 [Trypethelium subeluteriae]